MGKIKSGEPYDGQPTKDVYLYDGSFITDRGEIIVMKSVKETKHYFYLVKYGKICRTAKRSQYENIYGSIEELKKNESRIFEKKIKRYEELIEGEKTKLATLEKVVENFEKEYEK